MDDISAAVTLLPCGRGQRLAPSPDPSGHAAWTSCSSCSQEEVGQWIDARQPLSYFNTSSYGTANADMAGVAAGLTAGGDDASATCRACPRNAYCPGGALMIPRQGYWHSAANSTAMHRCPLPAACNGTAGGDGGDPLGFWPRADAGAAGGGGGPASVAAAINATVELPLLVNDTRGQILAACQAAWYSSSWSPGEWTVGQAVAAGKLPLLADSNNKSSLAGGTAVPLPPPPPFPLVPSNGSPEAAAGPATAANPPDWQPCLLWYQTAFSLTIQTDGASGTATPATATTTVTLPRSSDPALAQLSYMQQQCAPGYTGHLCAVCQAGHYGNANFQCSSCPPLGRSVALGLLAFLGSVVLVVVATTANLRQDYTVDSETVNQAEASEVMKVGGVKLPTLLAASNNGYHWTR